MASVINTNVMTMTAQRNLSRSQSDLSTAVTRLSSGLRINSAKDDAAGLAIATRMGVQISGLGVAARNANDGISIAQTAEGAMDELTRSLTRANDLAVQAASYNTAGDRNALNNEVQQLISEMGRVVSQTRYNGETLLAGGFNASIQVGVEVNETISVNVGDLNTSSLGVATSYSAVSGTDRTATAFADSMVLRNGADGDLATTDTISGSLGTASFGSAVAATANSADKIAAVNALSGSTGVEAFSFGNVLVSGGTGTAAATANGDISINGVSIDGAASGLANTAAAINAKSDDTGVTASFGTAGNLVLSNSTGEAIKISVTATGAGVTGFSAGDTVMGEGQNGMVVLNDTYGTTGVGVTAGVATALTGVANTATSVSLTNQSVADAEITSVSEANLAILAFGKAIDTVNDNRSELGAKLNRLESTIRNLENVRENTSAAQSRIQDADFAMETAKLTRAQILQQAGTAMVAQANQLPNSVLSLLQ